ncbi:hypothetical protein AFM11_20805 [Mycolicibacterium wolinskyi]|uniref:Uncharacterized protein n=1 Tax=Mycolicibacterium wolinskyi TaxID=59750 RepID=A0A132PIV5_9MYCO|nr:hypothetical protein AFM11_20805 [Mycolicibacterium wolinskyi]
MAPHRLQPFAVLRIAGRHDRGLVQRHPSGDRAQIRQPDPAQVGFAVRAPASVLVRLGQYALFLPPAQCRRCQPVEGGGLTDLYVRATSVFVHAEQLT